jgi:hypothetical protein
MQTAHQFKLNGHKALLADHCELVDLVTSLITRIDAQDARIAQLEYLVIEEIMAGLVKPAELRGAVHELQNAHLRQPQRQVVTELRTSPQPGQKITADTWLPNDWVMQYTAAVEGV